MEQASIAPESARRFKAFRKALRASPYILGTMWQSFRQESHLSSEKKGTSRDFEHRSSIKVLVEHVRSFPKNGVLATIFVFSFDS